MKFNAKVLLAGTAAVAGLALVGAGAGAAFNDQASAHQHIDTGTLVLNISAPDGTVSPNGHSVSWSITNSGSAINQNHTVTLTNAGTLPLLLTTASFADPGSGSDLAQELQANFDSNTGSLASVEAPGYVCVGSVCTLPPGGTYQFPLDFTGDLSNAAEGQSVDPTLTVNAVEANPAQHDAAVNAAGSASGFVRNN
ncbi:MAG: hypothetical protein J2P16_14645 [Mycobacterium sp.]|nr:hypothetical protein [Mycobacterium sp.]